MLSNKCSGVKVQYLDPRCSGIEVKVLEIGNTQVKYKYLRIVRKYTQKNNGSLRVL